MARYGCQKVIIIINGHGGNNALLQYFTLVQLDSPKEYVVYTVNDTLTITLGFTARDFSSVRFELGCDVGVQFGAVWADARRRG